MITTNPTGVSIRKTFFYCLAFSVVLGAVLGIFSILSGKWDWFEVRILLTTLIIGATSICGMANAAYLATGRGRLVPLAGLAGSLGAGGMFLFGMWTELPGAAFWKTAVILAIYAIALAHLSLLSMARLAERFQWSLWLAHGVILGVASIIAIMILAENHEFGLFQLLGVGAIADAAISILIPIFHKIGESQETPSHPKIDEKETIDQEIAQLRAKIDLLEARKQSLL